MRLIGIMIFAVLVAGCQTTAAPNSFNGQYYMAGDTACTNVRAATATTVMCSNSKGEDTGYRNAMTAADIQMWQFQQMRADAELQALTAQVNANNRAFQVPQYPVYQSPAVAPVRLSGPTIIHCMSASIYTQCRN